MHRLAHQTCCIACKACKLNRASSSADRSSVAAQGVKLLRTDNQPAVYGEWLHAESKHTVLLYGHYDVQVSVILAASLFLLGTCSNLHAFCMPPVCGVWIWRHALPFDASAESALHSILAACMLACLLACVLASCARRIEAEQLLQASQSQGSSVHLLPWCAACRASGALGQPCIRAPHLKGGFLGQGRLRQQGGLVATHTGKPSHSCLHSTMQSSRERVTSCWSRCPCNRKLACVCFVSDVVPCLPGHLSTAAVVEEMWPERVCSRLIAC